ncbi:MAG: NDP-sugar synthase [Pseudomonadota bacterium]
MTQAMILAAGMGTRMGSISEETPKPLLPVCNRPLIRWATQLFIHYGLKEIGVNLHHLGHLIKSELKVEESRETRFVFSPEPQILGTGGGIKAMASLLFRETAFVLNAKVVIDVDLQKLLAFHRSRNALATMVVFPHPNPEPWGAIGVDRGHWIVRILDKRKKNSSLAENFIFTGLHVLEPEFIDSIPEGPCCVVRTAYLEALENKGALAAYVHRGYFFEHSTPGRYLQGNFNLLDGAVNPPARPGPLCGVDPTAKIHSTAKIVGPVLIGAGCQIGPGAIVGPYAVLGDGVSVSKRVIVTRGVVWADVNLAEDCHRSIVTPRNRVEVPEEIDCMATPRDSLV